jgi:chemotaxis signal transduction protein
MSMSVEELRTAFDREFREPYLPKADQRLGLILLRIGDESYALPLTHMTAIHALPQVGALPARAERGLVGLATVRNSIVPVFDLAVSLGARTAAAPGTWLVIGMGDSPVGWTFDWLDAQVFIEPPEGGLQRTITVAGEVRRVIDLEELRR